MSSLVFTHIESVNDRQGSDVLRVLTGAGIYDVSRDSPVSGVLSEFSGPVVLAVSATGGSSRIVGIATRDGSRSAGRIDYAGEVH